VEKVNRVKQFLTAPRSQYYIIAFGDSRGDNEMLNYADEAHYQPFKS
ncbi:MAG: HAD-IB family hydrolase, partial [Prevotella salivae]|nr:HAD-IB family hydrolase [Segatella salivae]